MSLSSVVQVRMAYCAIFYSSDALSLSRNIGTYYNVKVLYYLFLLYTVSLPRYLYFRVLGLSEYVLCILVLYLFGLSWFIVCLMFFLFVIHDLVWTIAERWLLNSLISSWFRSCFSRSFASFSLCTLSSGLHGIQLRCHCASFRSRCGPIVDRSTEDRLLPVGILRTKWFAVLHVV